MQTHLLPARSPRAESRTATRQQAAGGRALGASLAMGFALMAARAVHAQSLPSYAARSGLPSFRLAQPSATITPGDALAYYGSPSVPDHAAISPRITALARALEHNPDRIYQFVRNSIEFEPQFGLHKGGDGVLLDGAGGRTDGEDRVDGDERAAGPGAGGQRRALLASGGDGGLGARFGLRHGWPTRCSSAGSSRAR